MDEIKSAWELALERTKDIVTDRDALAGSQQVLLGKKLASRYLEDPGKCDLLKELQKFDGQEREQARQGCLLTLQQNFTLPLTELAGERNARVRQALLDLTNKDASLRKLFDQIQAFFANYAEERAGMQTALEQQYEPRLRQKEAALAKQLGTAVKLTPGQDPEFIQLLKKQLGMFDDRYQKVLAQAREEIGRLTGLQKAE